MVGCDTQLVAPVTVGDDVYVASGTDHRARRRGRRAGHVASSAARETRLDRELASAPRRPSESARRSATARITAQADSGHAASYIAVNIIIDAYVRNNRLCRSSRRVPDPPRRPWSARISRLRFRRHRDAQRSASRWKFAAPSASSSNLRRAARRSAAQRPYRHRAYAMGHAWASLGNQRPSAQGRPGRGNP